MVAILGGDVTVEYLANNRLKYMYWSGAAADTRTMNELYSAMATLLDETTTIDSGTAFSAETPVEYTTGKIDSGDSEPWYVTFDLMEHITGGALRTTGWLRAVGTNTGIVIAPVAAPSAIVAADVGNDITHADLDAGTLLEVIDTGAGTAYLVIRPDSSAAANNFDSVAGNLTCNAHVEAQTDAATSGDMIWANLYSIGTIDTNVHLYLYQGEAADDADRNRRYSWNSSTGDWYGNGHIDTCVPIKDITSATWAVIDDGYITVFARKFTDLFASFEVENSTTSGGRNPIPLQTSADLDNITGIQKVTTGVWAGAFTDGEIISAPSGARGIVDFSESTADTHIVYTPIDDPQLDFTNPELITGATSGATATTSAVPVDHGPAAAAWFTNNVKPTAAFAYATYDVDDNGSDESYGITIDCNQNPLTEVYEWLKYATRNGEVTNDLDGINGERYIGAEVYLKWSGAVGGAIAEGGDVSQATSGATGVIVAYSNADKVMLLRDVRGTFDTAHLVTDNDNAGTVTPDVAATTFAPKTASPLGTFAGGTFFGARGVLLSDWLAADENKFQLTPMEGGTKERPQAISITVTNLIGTDNTTETDDRVSVFRLSGGDVNKGEMTCKGGEVEGDATLEMDAGINQDVPGKTTGGSLVLVDDVAGVGDEYKIRYSSWTGAIFTLANIAEFVSAALTDTNTVVHPGAPGFLANVKRGDMVYNTTRNLSSYVKSVTNDTTLELESDITGQIPGDSIEINCIPIALVDAADKCYVPFIDCMADATSESVSVIYVNPIDFRVIVRNTRNATKIKPYSSDGSSTGTDQSIPTIRTEDTIVS